MVLDGILPDQGEVEEEKVKVPETIPQASIVTVASEEDVDTFPRGAIAFLPTWDEDMAFDLAVAGAALTLVDRPTHEELAGHEDFDPDGFGILEEGALWLPGLEQPYRLDGDTWRL